MSVAQTPLLSAFCTQLQSSPVEAAESTELLELYHLNPVFHQSLAAPDRWRLLFGLATILMDYSDGLDLEAHFLPLPGNLPALSFWQICEALVCNVFSLDGVGWAEEVQSPRPLAIAQLEACDATLSASETMDRLDQLLSEALLFIDGCDDHPLSVGDHASSRQGLLWLVWTGLKTRLPGHAKTA